MFVHTVSVWGDLTGHTYREEPVCPGAETRGWREQRGRLPRSVDLRSGGLHMFHFTCLVCVILAPDSALVTCANIYVSGLT